MPCFVYSAQYACTHAENYTVRCNHPPWYIFMKTMAASKSLLIPRQIRISRLPENKLQNGSYLPSGIQWVRELLVFISLIAIDICALQKSDNLCIFPLHIYVHTLTLQCLSSGPKFLLCSKNLVVIARVFIAWYSRISSVQNILRYLITAEPSYHPDDPHYTSSELVDKSFIEIQLVP